MNETRQPRRFLAPFIGVVSCAYGVASLMYAVAPIAWRGSGFFPSLILSDALLFALAGIALGLPERPSPSLRYTRVVAGAMLMALPVVAAIFTLLPLTSAAPALGGATALAFVLAGMVLTALPLEKTVSVARLIQALSIMVSLLGLIDLAVRALGVEVMSPWYGDTEGGMLSSVAVMLLGVGLYARVCDVESSRCLYADKDDLKITLIAAIILVVTALSAGVLGFGLVAHHLAADAPIGDSNPGMTGVAIDGIELYEPVRRQFETILALLLVLVFVGIVLLRWRITPLVRKLMAEIDERRWAEGELRKLSLAVEQSASMVVITDHNGVIEYVNQKFTKVTGYARGEVAGKTPRILQSGHTHPDEYRRLWKTISAGGEWRGEFQNRKKSGELYWVYESISPIRNEEGAITHYLAVEEDVTARKQAEERLTYLAHYDGLTNLPNRVLFCDRLKQAMIEATERKRLVALLFLDLDGFKAINDSLGHEFGDRLLKEVAASLTKCVRRGDTVARMGGDEFTIILADIAHVEDATVVARKIVRAFSRPFSVDDKELLVTASIGITLYPFDDDNVDALIKNADVAMYRAKELGRNNYQFYTSEMNRQAMERLAFETSLRRALDEDQLCLFYQPVIDLCTDAVLGAEALIHWCHPHRGVIHADQFVPLAEETGLIVPIGAWALRVACAQARAWQDQGLGRLRLALNLSGRQLQQTNLPETVRQAMSAVGLEPDRLGLELRESLLVLHDEPSSLALDALHAMGIALAVDHFGSGYSSLADLRRYHIGILKIDRGLVQRVGEADAAAIVRAIVLMARSLGILTVAEGVETEEQIAFLRRCGCDAAQGPYICKPLSEEEFACLARSTRRLTAAGAGAD